MTEGTSTNGRGLSGAQRLSRVRRSISAGCLVACLCGAASAQEPGASSSIDYQAMFRAGAAHYENRDYVAAIATWERLLQSLGEKNGWKVLYNLGLAYEAVGDATVAVERFEAFVRILDARGEALPPELAERRTDAAGRLERFRATHGAVRLPAAPGVVVLVRVDGGPPRPAGFVAWLPPGEHRIEIGSGTSAARVVTVDIRAKQTVELVTAPLAPPASLPVSRPQPASPSSAQSPKPAPAQVQPSSFPTTWVLLGAGASALSMALPAVMYGRASDKRDEALALGAGHMRYEDAYDDYQDARRQYQVSYAVPATFAAITLAIVGVHVLGSNEPEPVRVRAVASPDGGMIWASRNY